MATIRVPQDTTFTFDVPGRYACNTLDEALDSTNTSLPDQVSTGTQISPLAGIEISPPGVIN